ncbi:MAG: hypothetical protein KC502_04725 [Myxococcales bacterium]|nr:hypothetical protein [Myxococcales bacterium]
MATADYPIRPRQRDAIGKMALIALFSGLLACSTPGEDSKPDAGDSQDADAVIANTNFVGATCASNLDCAKYGLSCYVTNDKTGTGICSRGCETETDCGGGLAHCNNVEGALVCTLPRYCDPCTSAQECGPEAPICAKDDKGIGFCTTSCTVNQDACSGDALCRKYGPKVTDFACMPARGSCSGDGSQCSPCKTNGDCGDNHTCFQADGSTERFCSQHCNPKASGNTGCAAGFQCVPHGDKGLCYQVIGGKPRPSCSVATRGYCDPCVDDWQCASNRCATKNNKSFCVQKEPCSKDSEGEDCPLGGVATFCVPSSKGTICAPPPAFNCHGYMACFSHPCGANESCINGECKAN